MCRNIKTLFNFDPPATDEEIREASLQFVRKLSGFTKPSRANEAAFDRAVREMTAAARALLDPLVTEAGPRIVRLKPRALELALSSDSGALETVAFCMSTDRARSVSTGRVDILIVACQA